MANVINPCHRCRFRTRMSNSDWCRACWQGWWTATRIDGENHHRGKQKRAAARDQVDAIAALRSSATIEEFRARRDGAKPIDDPGPEPDRGKR